MAVWGGVVPGSLVDYTEAFERPVGGLGGFGSGVTAFGEDEAGNFYFSEIGGRLFIVFARLANPGAVRNRPPPSHRANLP